MGGYSWGRGTVHSVKTWALASDPIPRPSVPQESVAAYHELIRLVAAFTVHSLESWAWTAASVYYPITVTVSRPNTSHR